MQVDPETEICVTCGSTEAMLGVLDPGDELIVFERFHEKKVHVEAGCSGWIARTRGVLSVVDPPRFWLSIPPGTSSSFEEEIPADQLTALGGSLRAVG